MTYDRTRADVGGRASSAPRSRPAPVHVGQMRERAEKGRLPADGGLFAARSNDRRLRVAGIALAAAGLLMVIFSFFTWTAASDDGLSISVTGMGSVTLEISDARAQSLGGATEVAAELDKRSNSPGVVTAGLGALIVASGAMLLVNRYPGFGALVGAVPALIGLFMSLEYLFAPGTAVLDGTGDAGIGFAAIGLWLVTLGACVAVAVSCHAVIVAMRSTRRPLVRKASDGTDRSARRPSTKSPVPADPRITTPRYREHAPAAPRPSRHPDFRAEPGHRARPAGQTDRMGRRPSETHLRHPGVETYRPSPTPSPRQHPNRHVPQADSRRLPPVRQQVPNAGVDRGLPPMRRSRQPPPPPPPRRPPLDPREPTTRA